MSQSEVHYQGTRRRETVSLFLRFLQDHVIFYFQIVSSLPVSGVILWILTLWPTEPSKSPNLSTTQSCTCEVADLTWQVCRWSPYISWWKSLQAHCWGGRIKAGIGTPRLVQNFFLNQTSQIERGNWSSLVPNGTPFNMTEESQRCPGQNARRDFTRFQGVQFVGKNGRVSIVD